MRRIDNTTGGFTIIEVIIFLAISSFMIIIAATSIGGRTRDVQFTDAARSVESLVERHISLVETGSLIDDGAECRWDGSSYRFDSSNGTCVFLGYMFEFGDYLNSNATNPERGEVYVYQMFGKRLSSSDLASCLAPDPSVGPLYCAQPIRVPSAPVAEFKIPWGVEVVGTKYYSYRDSNGVYTRDINPKAVGYLKDPSNQNVQPIAVARRAYGVSMESFENLFDDQRIYDLNNVYTRLDGEFSAAICLSNRDNLTAEIGFGHHERQETIDVHHYRTSQNSQSWQCNHVDKLQ